MTPTLTPRARRFRALTTGLALAVLGTTGLAVAPRAEAGTAPVVFDFVMPARFGADRNGDGLANDPHNTAGTGGVTTFTVTLDGCANTGTTSYTWTGFGVDDYTTTQCRSTTTMTEGVKLVTLTLSDGRSVQRAFRINDIVIVSMGDSAGSGEGNPDRARTSTTAEAWQNRRCHRSSLAGSARAARSIEDADSHTSVTFVHVACSGATVPNGVLGTYSGIEGSFASPLPSQVDQVRTILGNRSIDAILLSVGINDVGFGDIITKCIVQGDCTVNTASAPLDLFLDVVFTVARGICNVLPAGGTACNNYVDDLDANATGATKSAARLFAERLPLLPGRYSSVADRFELAKASGGLGTPASRVYITNYPDAGTDEQGRVCNPDNFLLDPFRSLFGISRTEWAWTRSTTVPQLNGAVNAGATAQGWRAVTGVASGFFRHGYCAANGDRWIRRIDESFSRQNNEKGTMHPNSTGHAFIRDRIVSVIRPVLLPGV
jgi:hypothetical protein